MTVNGDNHHIAKTGLIGQINADNQFDVVWSSEARSSPTRSSRATTGGTRTRSDPPTLGGGRTTAAAGCRGPHGTLGRARSLRAPRRSESGTPMDVLHHAAAHRHRDRRPSCCSPRSAWPSRSARWASSTWRTASSSWPAPTRPTSPSRWSPAPASRSWSPSRSRSSSTGLLGLLLEVGDHPAGCTRRPLDTPAGDRRRGSMILQQLAKDLFGAQGDPVQRAELARRAASRSLGYDWPYTPASSPSCCAAGCLAGARARVLQATARFGRQIRATVQNRDLAETMGISTRRRRPDHLLRGLRPGRHRRRRASPRSPARTRRSARATSSRRSWWSSRAASGQLKGTVIAAWLVGVSTAFLTDRTSAAVRRRSSPSPSSSSSCRSARRACSPSAPGAWHEAPGSICADLGRRLLGDRRAGARAASLVAPRPCLSDFRLGNLGKYCCWAIAAVGIGLAWGRGGMLVMGQGVFFGLGGYAMAMHLKLEAAGPGGVPDFMVLYGDGTMPALVGAVPQRRVHARRHRRAPAIVAGILGYAIFKRRVRGAYFAILTQALAVAFATLLVATITQTGGFNGLNSFSTFFGYNLYDPVNKRMLYFIAAGLLIVLPARGAAAQPQPLRRAARRHPRRRGAGPLPRLRPGERQARGVRDRRRDGEHRRRDVRADRRDHLALRRQRDRLDPADRGRRPRWPGVAARSGARRDGRRLRRSPPVRVVPEPVDLLPGGALHRGDPVASRRARPRCRSGRRLLVRVRATCRPRAADPAPMRRAGGEPRHDAPGGLDYLEVQRPHASTSTASRPSTVSTSRCSQGELHFLIGPNGAGKTTARRRPDRPRAGHRTGRATAARTCSRCKSHQIVRAGIGRTFQTATVFERAERAAEPRHRGAGCTARSLACSGCRAAACPPRWRPALETIGLTRAARPPGGHPRPRAEAVAGDRDAARAGRPR